MWAGLKLICMHDLHGSLSIIHFYTSYSGVRKLDVNKSYNKIICTLSHLVGFQLYHHRSKGLRKEIGEEEDTVAHAKGGPCSCV